MYFGMYSSISIGIFIICFLITVGAQIKLRTTFGKYANIKVRSGMTGAGVAREILNKNGLAHVNIEISSGKMTDHYDPRKKVVRLSQDVYQGQDVAAVSVAAHEIGHALQDAEGYAPLKFRNAIAGPVALLSKGSWILIIVSIFFSVAGNFAQADLLFDIGIILFVGVIVFYLVTLPVEFNASNRALRALTEYGVVTGTEIAGSKKVLWAAALTYIAALAVAILELIRLIIIRER